MQSRTDKTSQLDSETSRKQPSKRTEDEDASEVVETVEYQELADENQSLNQELKKANKEIQRLRDNL